MKQSFIDYAMSVITQRALPDVRDGFKPVHRRVLYAMDELGLDPSKSFLKSARIVGDVLGKYHPHGDSAVYETMVRMTQDFSMLLPLVQGHGNFGSIDGDSAAAMRYTEAKLSHPAIEMLKDLEKKVVDFQENYDGKLKEPVVLPARFPNLLVNGASGIAVGMATSIPSHNLNEAIKGILHYIDNPDITVAKLMKHIKGPDFPTGGIIINKNELLNIYETGTGRVRIRSKLEIENAGYGRSNVVITEIPYTQAGNKTKLIEKMEELARDKKLDEVSDIRDESSKDGIRIVLEVKKGVDIDDFLNKLYKKTALEDTFKVNFLALVDGKPQILNLKQVIHHFVEFQKEITRKKHEYLLAKANNEQEVLEGLIKAHDIIDLIIEILRGSKDVKMAKACMMQGVTDGIAFRTKKSEKEASKLNFTERQADAILDMRLQKLISLELDKLNADYQEIRGNIKEYEDILGNESTLLNVIKDYLQEIAKKFGQKRKTQIDEIEVVQYVEKFKEEELYVLMDRFGYIKTTDVTNYNRSSDDTVKEFKHTFLTMNTDKLYLFTKEGNLHTVKLADVPKGKVKDKGVPIQTITKLGKEEEVLVESFQSIADKKLMFITKQGMVKWLNGSEFDTNRSMSSATKLEEGDELLSVQVIGDVKDYSHIVLVSNKRFALKIAIEEIPELKKTSKGVKTISLTDDDTLNQVYLLRSDDKESVVEIDGKAVDLVSMKTKKRNQVGVKI
ncbi:DNA topoisomerase 4 subunit A (plasmid) [Aneurinibacillus sp. Ricciae_BoGa-3]|uniref:DNA gyrase/topoisomerase IV subunit A n=1 Tax=Aneurinibacillus sp. Ricciae_BoGa-3 TaxID=3022697 RepID=UPI0023407279|nr:DNA topoisomerase (ATP-hydrolyzing) [Aneurinibacillus sp. Ricciae_BoGa-3]WCK56955.1 DNA topoisomerase 4 subunit A [Aneurinibacillus sp. Ricciae_BoGa-3]